MRSFSTLITVFALSLSSLVLAENQTEIKQAPNQEEQALTPEKVLETKCFFLYCSLLSEETMLGGSDAAFCSTNFELLKAKVFAGSFEKLMEFWQANKTKDAYEALCKPITQTK